MTRKDIVRTLAGAAILFFCAWTACCWATTPLGKALMVFCALLGLFIFARATENLLAIRFPPPPKPAVEEPVWEDYFDPDEDDTEETP